MTAELLKLATGPAGRPPLQKKRDQGFLQALHLSGASRGFIVVAMEVKQAVSDVETELVLECRPKFARLAFRGLGADEYFAVLERDDVSRARFIHELA